jgi:hypothetical protein
MKHKIYKYIYKIYSTYKNELKSNVKPNFNKILLYNQHLKYHANMSGGNPINDKINSLELLLEKIKNLPNYGINQVVQKKLIDTVESFEKYDENVRKTLRDIMVTHGLAKEADELLI